MDSHTADTAMALASTPAKASRFGINDDDNTKKMASTPSASSAMLLSSPTAPDTSFPRKTPPALSTKARKKKMSLFGSNFHGDDSYDGPKDCFAERGSSVTMSEGFKQEATPQLEGSGNASPWQGAGDAVGGVGDGDSAYSFSSPARPPRETSLFSSDRMTPQRNLVGLFASPVPPQSCQSPTATVTSGNDSHAPSDQTTTVLTLPPRKLPSSPQRDEQSPGECYDLNVVFVRRGILACWQGLCFGGDRRSHARH